MATELDTAATVTPGVARIPATGRDPTEVFLGVLGGRRAKEGKE